MRILHTGDWHIGNYNGPEVNGENARFLDICKCLDALTQQAIEEKPDFIIVAGDVFHQARVWSDRGLRESQTAIHYVRMLEKVAPVIIVRGTPNHDSEQQFKMLETAFSGDDSVHIFSEPGVLTVYGYHGQTIDVAALPGFDRGFYRAKHPGLDKEEENAVFTQALEQIIIGMKAQCSGEHPAVLVGHYTIPGCNTESGQTQFFAQFEPVVDPATLAAADFDLTCFGHIHRPQMLDGCNNAFYCGAVSALNFNDEGQERGFYIHELYDSPVIDTDSPVPIPAAGRKFYPLPTREFKTIRLHDEDIAAINDGDDMTWLTDVDGKIVRVLYNCTDEHNKALNKTMVESKLYELGAFWVQEITPEKITVTVNKGALNDDDTPEDNLRTYLAERDVKEADTGRIVERARPIIAEATEANMTRSTTGAFVPVEIEVKNYRNYREETFSFEPIRFCTINGENGAGKSSLFMDAMCDCLFEETREGDIAGWISNNPDARSGSIKLTFRLGDSLYRVTRTRMKSGKATLNLAEQVDGEWVDRSAEKMRDTQAEILNVIGMDSLTLKATALIMQDQYGLFLTADKEARMTILGNILGLGAYGDMESIAASRLTETNREIRSVQEKAADTAAALPDDAALEEAERQAAAEIERLTAESGAAREKTDAMRLALTIMEEAAKRVVKLNSQITALGAKRAAAEATITAQRGIIMSADAILAEADTIATGLKEYRKHLEREKDLLAAKGKYDSLTRQIDTLKASRITEEMAAEDLHKKKQAMRLAKLFPAQQAVEAEAELTKAHEKYVATKEITDGLAARRTEYTDAQRRVEAARAHLDSLSRRAKLLEENDCPHAAEVRCSFLRDALEAKAGIEAAEAALTEALASVPTDYTPEQEKAALAILRELELDERKYSELAVVKAELAAAEERIADLDRQAEERRAKAAEMSVEIAQLETERDAMVADIKEYTTIKKRIAELAVFAEKEKQLPVAEEKKKTAEARIAELTENVHELEAERESLEAERKEQQEKTVGSNELLAEYTALLTRIEEIEKAMQTQNMALGAIKEQKEKAAQQREQIAELMQRAETLGIEAADLETLKQAFSQDGIPHNIVRSIIPIFEATATNILGQMSGGHMSVEFVMEKTLKSNSKKEVTALDIIINDSITGRLPYMSRSGGERVKAALAVILALAEIKSTKAGVQLGFLFIDEPPFLDAQGVTAYCDALEAIQNRYAELKVMAITHDPAMKSRFPQSVDIIKTADGSKVIYA